MPQSQVRPPRRLMDIGLYPACDHGHAPSLYSAQRSSSIRGTIATHFDGSSWKFMGGLGSAELSNPEAAEFTTGGLKAVLLFPWLALLWPGMPGQSSFKVSSRFAILDLLGFPAGTTRRPR